MYTIKLSDNTQITGLVWSEGRFWTDTDYRNKLTPEALSHVVVSCNESDLTPEIPDDLIVPEGLSRDEYIEMLRESHRANMFTPGEYSGLACYDYRKSGNDKRGTWRFYLAETNG